MSLYDKAKTIFTAGAGAGLPQNKRGKYWGWAYNLKPVEKVKVDELVDNGEFDGDSGWTISNDDIAIKGGYAFWDEVHVLV